MSLLSLTLLSAVSAVPVLNFAFNSQLPPVARRGQAYSYTFSEDTFKSSDGTITYNATDLPDWLSLNGRTLSGTPTDDESVDLVSFKLNAFDNSGSAVDDCELQVSSNSAPTYSEDALFSALEANGHVANRNSFVLVPNHPFEIDFPANFFEIPSGQTVAGHYAVTSGHSPLPIWLDFDGASGKFSGTAPPVNSEIAQAQQFEILYIVSTSEGYMSAAAEFNLLLGANVLAMNISSTSFNVTTDHWFSYSMPLTEISLNGESITKDNVSSATAQIPSGAQSWLQWNSDNFTLMGTPPLSAAGDNISVTLELTDKFSDAVSWQIGLDIASETNDTVFTSSNLPGADARRGQWFTYDLSSYILQDGVELSLGSGVDWLSVHNENLTINGQVPWQFQSAMVNITASLSSDKRKRATSDDNAFTAHLQLTGAGPMSSSASMSSSMSRTTSGASSSMLSSSMLSSSMLSSSRLSSSQLSSSRPSSSALSTSQSRSGTAASTPTSSSSSTATVAPIASFQKSSKKNVAIGCGVGIPVGLLALAALLLLFFCCRRRRKQAESEKAAPAGPGVYPPPRRSSADDFDPNEDSQISNPRPSSKGIAMAPVFRTYTSDSDSFVDALEYPGELNDDGTMVGTPDKPGKTSFDERDQSNAWNSPQRASTLNFLAMNGDDNASDSTLPVLGPVVGNAAGGVASHGSSESNDRTSAGGVGAVPVNTGTGRNYIPPVRPLDDVNADVPRESWRHTNTGERRWQEQRISHNSLASIARTEPPTVQIANQEFATPNPLGSNTLRQAENGQGAMSREYSSGVLHRVGSHSSSRYSESVRNSRPLSDGVTDQHLSQSSSPSQSSSELSDDSTGANFRPYRDENGELHWREENPTGSARLHTTMLDRKPSAAKAPKGDTGEFYFV